MEALRALRLAHDISADQVKQVRVWLDEGAYKAVGFPWVPTTPTSAQLNLTYCAALLLLEGDVFVDQFAEHKLADPRVLDLVSRIECTYDRDMDAFGSFQRRTRVEVELNDGRTLSTIGELRGLGGNPLTRDDVVEKFGKVTRGLLDPTAQAALIERCDRLEDLDNVRQLTELLKPAAG
jgi:2-methylcitrate dehydratase PrpD